ncbi:MAG: VOC family protein [Pseudomonadales bacterium]
MRITRIHQVGANLVDLEETKAFYTNALGARYIADFDPPGILFFEFAGTRILFEKGNPPAVLYFWVDDIDDAHATLVNRGVQFDSDPHLIHRDDSGTFDNPGTEEWMAFFKDPGGNTIAIATRR